MDYLCSEVVHCSVKQKIGCVVLIVLIFHSLNIENTELDGYTSDLCRASIEYCVHLLDNIDVEELLNDDIVKGNLF